MAACHLVTYADFTFLGDIYFGYLHDTRGEFVADRDVEFLTTELGVDFLVFLQVVDDSPADQLVLMLVGGPVA